MNACRRRLRKDSDSQVLRYQLHCLLWRNDFVSILGNLNVTNKYLQATSKTKRLAQDKLVDAILPTGILPKTNLIQ